ncbi:hypothetical protein P152DRAFT_454635 [Eremomyces bilateralis CBS 781.70]|uniref:Uncharacterized protein n=1 Tax=Eremomyces bilateralis CBS 781.70 TaxID=1392243 RepID=A0A6G1GES2_9PEZI|nr:uncharacterized protein P152DRAFT_454635 [Eremomyces bilateralis CBS 781.70]KAF1816370.1 hypothetical protein P152DRAFT_454635 [Eremomyces bilateralis CBS 781.70]
MATPRGGRGRRRSTRGRDEVSIEGPRGRGIGPSGLSASTGSGTYTPTLSGSRRGQQARTDPMPIEPLLRFFGTTDSGDTAVGSPLPGSVVHSVSLDDDTELPATPESQGSAGTPPVKSFLILISKETRMKMRSRLIDGERLDHVTRASEAVSGFVPKEELSEYIRRLDRVIRWNTFLTHSNINAYNMIDFVTDGKVAVDASEFWILRTKILDNVRTYKNKMLARFEIHIKSLIEIEPWIKNMNEDGLRKRLESKFNAQNFLFVWYYMKDYIDVDNSAPLGKWFMKNMYVNMGVYVKSWMDENESKDIRERLLQAYDLWALNEAFDDVDKGDFMELSQKFRNERKKKKRDFATINKNVHRYRRSSCETVSASFSP